MTAQMLDSLSVSRVRFGYEYLHRAFTAAIGYNHFDALELNLLQITAFVGEMVWRTNTIAGLHYAGMAFMKLRRSEIIRQTIFKEFSECAIVRRAVQQVDDIFPEVGGS